MNTTDVLTRAALSDRNFRSMIDYRQLKGNTLALEAATLLERETSRGQNKSSAKSYAKGERNENLCDPPQPGWKAERSKSVGHLMFGIPSVDAGKVDMFPTQR